MRVLFVNSELRINKLLDAIFIIKLTRNRSVVSSSSIKCSRYFYEQET